MKKETKILIISIVAVLIIAISLILILNKKTNSTIKTVNDGKTMLKQITKSNDLPSTETFEVKVNNIDEVKSFTGLKTNDNIEWIVASEPMMSSQAFSAVSIKVKDASKIDTMKQEILENINTSKWICVTAEKLYITNNGDIIFLIMADSDWAKIVYDNFKKYVNNDIGKELEKTSDEFSPTDRPVA